MKIPSFVLALFLPSAAVADSWIIAADDFDFYTSGGLAGQGNAANGWTSPWTGSALPYLKAAAAPAALNYQIPARGSLTSGPGCLEITTAAEPVSGVPSLTRNFTPTKADLYVGFTFQISTIGSGSDRFYADVLNETGALVLSYELTPSQNTAYPAWFYRGDGISALGKPLPNGTSSSVYQAVMELRHDGGSFLPGVWANPTAYAAPALSGSFPSDTPLSAIRFRITSADNAGPSTTIRLDNLRIGLTYDSVVPQVPANAEFPNFSFEPARRITWFGNPTLKYRVEVSDDANSWTPLDAGYTVGTNNPMEVFVTEQGNRKFYRVVSQPK